MPPSPVLSVEADQSPCGKHGCKETRPADWSAMRAPRRTCRSLLKFGLFPRNEQVRGVTRSLSRLEVVRADFGSPRLSQDTSSITKIGAECRTPRANFHFKKPTSPYSFERIEKLHTRLCKILGVAGHKRQVVAQGCCRNLRIGDRLCQASLLQFRSKTSPFSGDR